MSETHSPLPRTKTALIVAGPPGSGKSTLVETYARSGLPIFGHDAPDLRSHAYEDFSAPFESRLRSGSVFDLAELLHRHGRYTPPDTILIHADLFGIMGVYRRELPADDPRKAIRIRAAKALDTILAHYDRIVVSTVLVDCSMAGRLFTRRLLVSMVRNGMDLSGVFASDAARRTFQNSLEIYTRPRKDIFGHCYRTWFRYVGGTKATHLHIRYDGDMNVVVRKSSRVGDYLALKRLS